MSKITFVYTTARQFLKQTRVNNMFGNIKTQITMYVRLVEVR
jgi:hypothetical protein